MQYHKMRQQNRQRLAESRKGTKIQKLLSFQQWKKEFQHWYGLYELNTYISMCAPWEKILLNTLLLMVIAIVSYATVTYVPAHVLNIIRYLTPINLGQNATSFDDVQNAKA